MSSRCRSLALIVGVSVLILLAACRSIGVAPDSDGRVSPIGSPQLKRSKRTDVSLNSSELFTRGIDDLGADGGLYMKHAIQTIQDKWYAILRDNLIASKRGTHVTVTFKLNAEGEITLNTVEETAGKSATNACLMAIQDCQPYGKWTDQMTSILGKEQTMTFTFYYE